MTSTVCLALLALSVPSAVPDASNGAMLHTTVGGAGNSFTVDVGTACAQVPAGCADQISWVALGAKRSIVVLYDEPNFSGRALVLNGRGPHILADYEFDNRVASVRVVSLGQTTGILELLATLIDDSVEYYELRGLREAQRVTARWQKSFVLGNERECRWEYLRLIPPQDLSGLAIDPVVSAKLYVRHCRRVDNLTIYDVAITPRFECSVANRCSGLTIDFGKIDVLNLHVRVPATNVVRLLRAWQG